MDRLRRELGTSRAAALGALAPLILGLLGCPQLLQDDFDLAARADGGAEMPDAGAIKKPRGAADAGAPGPVGPMRAALTASPPAPGAGGPMSTPTDPGSTVCVAAPELCDGRDNDCDDEVDESPACASGCAGTVFDGRSAMFCGGAGATFASAEARCRAQGMRPVVIDSAQKSAAVLQAVAPFSATLSMISETQNAIWMDAHDGETEGTWHWGPSGTVFWIGDATGSVQNGAYVNWASGKPNNSGTGDGEDCAVLHVGTGAEDLGTWNDDTCEGLHAFLCEAPVP